MIFSSLGFIFLFLPVAVAGYHLLCGFRHGRPALFFLFFMSIFFYAYWKASYVLIILASILINYLVGQWLLDSRRFRKPVFFAGLCVNLGALAYYKYTDFAIVTVNRLFGDDLALCHIMLPIGISFFTFQQLAYLIDMYARVHQPDKGLLHYGLFVCFFPQLIAGPIVHHQEMMPQFAAGRNRRPDWNSMYAGMILFWLGVGKKTLLADPLSPLVGQVFDSFAVLTFPEAWMGSLGYTLQLYFDFSAYSDMALGCALFFAVRLPHNFFSPYKSRNIQEFWRRWHITLSRWLREYLYIPLGGNRKGSSRTSVNLFVTFLLGGLWHGAAWTFVLWGALHGLALVAHRLWARSRFSMPGIAAWAITFVFVNAAWVLFRATSFADAAKVYAGMLGLNGFAMTRAFKDALFFQWGDTKLTYVDVRAFVVIALLTAWLAPNALQILGNGAVSRIRTAWALIVALLSVLVLSIPERVTEFIYFQF